MPPIATSLTEPWKVTNRWSRRSRAAADPREAEARAEQVGAEAALDGEGRGGLRQQGERAGVMAALRDRHYPVGSSSFTPTL